MSKLAAAGLSSTVAGPASAGPAPRERVAGERIGAGHGLVHRAGALDALETGRAEPALEIRAALADDDRRGGPLGDDGGELVEVDALVAAAGDEHDRRLEGPERGDDRVRLGALGVVHEPDAIDRRRPARADARRP